MAMVEAGPVDDAPTPLMAHLDQKDFRVVSLDSKNGILANGAIDKGGADVTRELTAAGRALDIEVHDHVVARDGYTSDRERGLGFDDLRREVSSISKRYQIGG